MDHRQLEPLIDAAIDREIQSALGVEPSPEFVARLRTSVAAAPAVSRFPSLVPSMGAIAGVAALVVAAIIPFSHDRAPEQSRSSLPSTQPAAARPADRAVIRESEWTPSVDAPPLRSSRRLVKAVISKEPELPEVIVAPEDIKAFQDVVASAGAFRFEISPEGTLLSAHQQALMEITVPAIVIAPVSVFAGPEGVLQ